MKQISLVLLAAPLFAADILPAAEATLTKSQMYALASIAEKRQQLAAQNAELVKLRNEIAAEACKAIGVPDDKMAECSIDQDLSKVIWNKTEREPAPSSK